MTGKEAHPQKGEKSLKRRIVGGDEDQGGRKGLKIRITKR